MNPSRFAESTRAGRVALIGLPNAGKSTLLNAILGQAIAITSPHPQTTRETVRGILTDGSTQFVILDTPGVQKPRTKLGARMNETARKAAEGADVLVLLVEGPREGYAGHSPSIEAERALVAELPKIATILAINKVDRVSDKAALLPLIAAYAALREFAATVPISARKRDGVTQLLDEVRALLPVQPLLYEADTLSDQPVRFFVAEFVREQILRHTKQEVPHGVAVVVERFDESKPVVRIDAIIHVARQGHKKIVIGSKGLMLKSIGTAARLRIEGMLERRVHLALRVSVTPGWMDNPARLRDLGFDAREET